MTLANVGVRATFALLALLGVGCGRSQGTEHGTAHEPLVERVTRLASRDPGGGLSSDTHLAGVRRIAARGFDAMPAFYVAERTEHIRRFPCRECHTAPLGQLQARQEKDRKAHWEIELRHAGTLTMTCATCHAGGSMESLRTLTGGAVELDHAYQVCAQCHSSQARDWAGGAHGKRLGGWAPPRVVVSCPACHDPHQPRLDKRWPARASRLLVGRE